MQNGAAQGPKGRLSTPAEQRMFQNVLERSGALMIRRPALRASARPGADHWTPQAWSANVRTRAGGFCAFWCILVGFVHFGAFWCISVHSGGFGAFRCILVVLVDFGAF